jgi:RNA polymerase sigma-70 factor (ECF subfamily)
METTSLERETDRRRGDRTDEPDAVAIKRSLMHPEGFVVLFDRHFDAVHRYLHRRVGHDLADELAAEVFTQAFRRRASFQPLVGTALPWLYGIAANQVRRHRRTEVRRLRAYARTGIDEATHVDDLGVLDRLDAGRRGPLLADALASLSADDRETLSLVVFAELTYEEAGRALGVPPGTVASRMSRIRRALAARLRGDISPPTEETT